jgi:hypothetical protein
MATVERLLEIFRGSPEARQLAKRDAEERLTERERVAAAFAAARGQYGSRLAPLRHAVAVAEATATRRREDADDAAEAASWAHYELRVATRDIERQVTLLEGQLRASAPPVLDEFLLELDTLGKRAAERAYTNTRFTRHWMTQREISIVDTNWPQIKACLHAIREARAAVEPLRLVALDDAALAARLDALRVAIAATSVIAAASEEDGAA